ncbi:MAG: hypothetical protein ACM32O_13695 [Clostridia bacterium]
MGHLCRFAASWNDAADLMKTLRKHRFTFAIGQSPGMKKVEFVFSEVTEPQYFYLFLLFEEELM